MDKVVDMKSFKNEHHHVNLQSLDGERVELKGYAVQCCEVDDPDFLKCEWYFFDSGVDTIEGDTIEYYIGICNTPDSIVTGKFYKRNLLSIPHIKITENYTYLNELLPPPTWTKL